MSNLLVEDPDKLEELPLRDTVRPPDGRRHYRGSDFPYRKIQRFLTSRVGKYWNDVFSEFCHLDWVPRQYKTKEQIGHSVQLNTFIKDGKVWYYDGGFMGVNERSVDNEGGYYSRRDFFYVHPKTGILLHKQPHGHKSYKQQEEERKAKFMKILGDYHQLLKLDGVWYEVKGEPINTNIVEVDGLHYRYIKESTIAQREFKMGIGTQVSEPDDAGYVRINGRLAVPYREARWEGKRVGPKDCLVESAPQSGGAYYWNRPNYRSIKITVYRQLNSKQLKKYGLTNEVKTMGKPCSVCGNANCEQSHR